MYRIKSHQIIPYLKCIVPRIVAHVSRCVSNRLMRERCTPLIVAPPSHSCSTLESPRDVFSVPFCSNCTPMTTLPDRKRTIYMSICGRHHHPQPCYKRREWEDHKNLAEWRTEINLLLNISKTEELIVENTGGTSPTHHKLAWLFTAQGRKVLQQVIKTSQTTTASHQQNISNMDEVKYRHRT